METWPFFALRGVPQLHGRLVGDEDVVAGSVDDVDLLAQVKKDESFCVAEGDLHVAGQIDVLTVANDAVERRRFRLKGFQIEACCLESASILSRSGMASST